MVMASKIIEILSIMVIAVVAVEDATKLVVVGPSSSFFDATEMLK